MNAFDATKPGIPWDQIDTVLLDMDGTLLDLNFDNHFWLTHVPYCLACRYELDIEQARERVLPQYRQAEGTLDWYCVEHWTRTLDIDIVKLKQQVAHLIRLRPHALEFITWLKQRNLELRLVTNAHRKTLEIKMRQTGIASKFEIIVCAHDYGAPKEHKDFWHAFHKHHPFDLTRTLFIDDSLPVLRSARDFGIQYLRAVYQPDSKGEKKDVEEFEAFHHFPELMEQS